MALRRWWLPLSVLLLCALSAVPRLFNIAPDLPTNDDRDEQYYFAWAMAIRERGRPDVENGTGYPPGYLYMLAGEHAVLELVRGDKLDPAFDYYYYPRTINALIGSMTLVLFATLTHQVSGSRPLALASAFVAAFWPLFITDSRRAFANAPWLALTLLAFIFLVKGRRERRIGLLYLSLLFGVASFLFKYQSGVFLILPFMSALLYFRHLRTRLVLHLFVWAIALAVLFGWLILDYRILEIINTPGSETASGFAESGGLQGIQSFGANTRVLAEAMGGRWQMWVAAATMLMALLARASKRGNIPVDLPALADFGAFLLLYYVLMSFFKTALAQKWLVAGAILWITTLAGLHLGAKLVGGWLVGPLGNERAKTAGRLITAASFAVAGALFVYEAGSKLLEIYEHKWSVPNAVQTLNDWFTKNVPQGGRVVSEVHKLVYNYRYAPRIFHNYDVDSIFDEPLEAYRARGYEYLIWNSLNSEPTDQLADLESEERRAYLQNLEVVLSLTGDGYWGPDIVVFKLDPLPTHEMYAWFGDMISFRGYDLPDMTFSPGGEVPLTLYWMSVLPTHSDLIVFVHVWNSARRELVAQHDAAPGQGFDRTWQWQGDMQFHVDQRTLSILDTAAPGEYEVRIGMYDSATGERVPITPVGQSEPIPDSVLTLQTIRIAR